MLKQIQLRWGTTAEWTASNPVLLVGEAGVEITEDKKAILKLGNGTDNYLDLEPFKSAHAGNVAYDNTESGLNATDTQGAIDEIMEGFGDLANILEEVVN